MTTLQNRKKIEKGAHLLLEGLGVNIYSEDFIDTPARIANSLLKYIGPADTLDVASAHLSITFPSNYSDLIQLTNLTAKSLCPHHLMPILYTAELSYIPLGGRVVGSSKPYLFFKELARLPVMQEELTSLFCDIFESKVKPAGLSFEVTGTFLCYENDGIHSSQSHMKTIIRRGTLSG